MTPLPASVYFGQVGHTRQRPTHHALRYGMFSVLVDIDGPQAQSDLRFFSRDRFNLVSLNARDYGRGDGDLRAWIIETLIDAGIHLSLGRVQLLAAPRVLGLVFNPLSLFFCHDPTGRLRAVIFDVSNFHSGRCAYAFEVPLDAAGPLRFACPKRFFVSPFNPVDGEYRFRLERDENRYRLGIQLFRDGGCTMSAVHRAAREPLTDKQILRAQFKHPFNTLGIVGGILLEAIKLRLKGLTTIAPRRGTIDTLPRRH